MSRAPLPPTSVADPRRGEIRANLPVPEVPAVIDPSDPEGVLSTGSQLADLEVRIPLWGNPAQLGETDVLDLYWSGASANPVSSQAFKGPIEPSIFPFTLKVDKNLLQSDGAYQVWYSVKPDTGAATPSDLRTVTIDTRPPGYDRQLSALLLPDDLLNGVINEAYLSSHGDQVELRVPSPIYLDAGDGDTIDLYWSRDNPPTSPKVASKQVDQAEIDASDIRVNLPGDVIRDPDRDGAYFATYKVRDRAGNETLTYSLETRASVALKPLPGGELPEPEFPDATLWGYINCEHEPWNGIRVRITFVRNLFERGDLITLSWQGYRTLNGVDPIAETEGHFEASIRDSHIGEGYIDILIQPFSPYIEPIIEGSAIATYTLLKADGSSATSYGGLVKINRLLPDGEVCGPAA